MSLTFAQPLGSSLSDRLRAKSPRPTPGRVGVGVFSAKWVLGFVSLHMAAAYMMKQYHFLAGIHAVATLLFGLRLCFTKSQPLQTAQWAAYVVGSELLWRMCKAAIPWEFAKESISLICLISLARSRGTRGSLLPALYLALLLPASLLTFVELPLEEARQAASFNLSGPICLALSALWFSRLTLTMSGLQRIGIVILGPIGGAAFIILFGIATTEVDFISGSNAALSGGYGPNQVSSMLSLGALFAGFLFLGEKHSKLLKAAFPIFGLWLLGQSALTFSRTGIYLFGAAFGIAMIFLGQRKGGKAGLLLFVMIVGSGVCVVLPMLDAFTGGKLDERFKDQGVTGRDTVAKLDLQIFLEHPVLGAGAGVSAYYRADSGDEHAAHTEYTRMLADHGVLGAAALVVLLGMTGIVFLRAPGPWAKAIVSALAVWGFLFMAVTAMRLAAPALVLGLIHARFLPENQAVGIPRRSVRRFTRPGGAPPAMLPVGPAKIRRGTFPLTR